MIPPLHTAQREAMVGGVVGEGRQGMDGFDNDDMEGPRCQCPWEWVLYREICLSPTHDHQHFCRKQHFQCQIFFRLYDQIFPHIVNCCQWIWSSWPTFRVINSDLTFKRLDFKTLTITSRGKCASRLQKRNIHGKKVIRWLHNWFWGDFFYFYLRKSLTCSPQSAYITKILMTTVQNPWTVLTLF